ncbi:UNVERIFIED_ORG: putative nucleotidyltransferase [Pseudomonas parafulva]|nr:putative nucleotidyltransferase [Pseudomonas parafulva]
MLTATEAEKQIHDLMAKQEVTATVAEFKTKVECLIHVEKFVLLGSRARGDNEVDSDIDIALVLSAPASIASR